MGLCASGVKKQNNNNKDSQGRFDMSRVVDSQLLCLIGLQSLNLVSDIATLKKKRKEGQKDTIKTKQAKKWFANKYWLWLPIQDKKKKMKKKKKKRGQNNNNKNLDCLKRKQSCASVGDIYFFFQSISLTAGRHHHHQAATQPPSIWMTVNRLHRTLLRL